MAELIPGIDVNFGGGRIYLVPPLTLGALQRLQGKLSQLNKGGALEPSTIETVIAATHSALRRNYPDITIEEVGDLVDVANMHDVISSVLDVAGIKRKAIEDAAKNPPAQPTLTELTGLDSSQAFVPIPGGPGTMSETM